MYQGYDDEYYENKYIAKLNEEFNENMTKAIEEFNDIKDNILDDSGKNPRLVSQFRPCLLDEGDAAKYIIKFQKKLLDKFGGKINKYFWNYEEYVKKEIHDYKKMENLKIILFAMGCISLFTVVILNSLHKI